jgi:hypothetical protein
MLIRRLHQYLISVFLIGILLISIIQYGDAQEQKNRNDISTTWLYLQSVPNLTWVTLPAQTNFAFEWEVAPILYSFGMNKQDPPWHFFFVTQPERFAGSIELNASTQFYISKVGTSHWGFSGQLIAHLPLVEKGENLGLNLGVAHYSISKISSNYVVLGFSTLFGFVHFNVKYSPSDDIWMNSLDLRFF